MLTSSHTALPATRTFNWQVDWAIPAFISQPQSFTALWTVLIFHPNETRRLSLVWLYTEVLCSPKTHPIRARCREMSLIHLFVNGRINEPVQTWGTSAAGVVYPPTTTTATAAAADDDAAASVPADRPTRTSIPGWVDAAGQLSALTSYYAMAYHNHNQRWSLCLCQLHRAVRGGQCAIAISAIEYAWVVITNVRETLVTLLSTKAKFVLSGWKPGFILNSDQTSVWVYIALCMFVVLIKVWKVCFTDLSKCSHVTYMTVSQHAEVTGATKAYLTLNTVAIPMRCGKINLLKIFYYYWVSQWTNFENQLAVGKVGANKCSCTVFLERSDRMLLKVN